MRKAFTTPALRHRPVAFLSSPMSSSPVLPDRARYVSNFLLFLACLTSWFNCHNILNHHALWLNFSMKIPANFL